MASERQMAANRSNAQRSTGPKTEDGKAHSRMNAVTHGVTAKTIVLAGENPEAYEALKLKLIEEFAPESIVEQTLVERLATTIWRLKRVPRFEAALLEAQRVTLLRSDIFNERQAYERRQSSMDTVSHEDPEFQDIEARLDKLGQYQRQGTPLLGRTLRKILNEMDVLTKLSGYEIRLAGEVERILAQLRRIREERPTVDCEAFETDDDAEF